MGLVDVSVKRGVAVLRFNKPNKLNAWSLPMLREKELELAKLAGDDAVDAVVLTGTGKYYSAGVDLAAVIKPMPPAKLVSTIRGLNEQLFDQFLTFPKPIFAAINGPTIGAAATSATLTDGILANQRATFHTPFAALGLVPEGCSSAVFPKLFGDELANKMLNENYKLGVEEAVRVGMVSKLVETEPTEGPDEPLIEAARAHALEYVAAHGRKRSRTAEQTEHLRSVNRQESQALAEAFMSPRFFRAMEANAERRGNTPAKLSFQALRITRPLWSLLL